MASPQSEMYTTLYNTATQALLSHSQEQLGKNVQALSKYLSDDCQRFFAPASYSAASGEPGGLTNAAYEKLVAWQITLVEKWSVEITEVLIDEPKRSAMIWGRYTSTLKHSGQSFNLEFIQILHLNQLGDKVEKVVEFLDNAEAKRFDAALQEKQN